MTTLHLTGANGDELEAELFLPAQPNRRAVLLVHEVFGLDAFMRSVAERFANEGYVALIPDLYSREGLPGPASTDADPAPSWTTDAIRAAVASLPDRRVLADLEAGAALLAERDDVDPDKLAVLGFCMGGNYAYLLGCHSHRLSAAVDFYGRIVYADLSAEKPVQPLEMGLNLSVPLLGLFGEEDASIPLEHVDKLRDTLAAFAKDFECVTYPGAGHGFFNQLRSPNTEAAAQDAWRRVLAFLDERLD